MIKVYKEPIVYIVVYVLVCGTTALFRHWLFHTYANDLGIFVQALSTTARGEGLLYETPDSRVATCYLGIHFSPFLLVLVPLVYLFPPAEMLLLLQTIMLAIPAYFIYVDALKNTGSKVAARVLTIIFLANPALHGINLYDFHMHSILLPFLYLFVKYARKIDLGKSILIYSLMMTITEQSIMVGVGYLLYILFKSIEKRKFFFKELSIMTLAIILSSFIAFSSISYFGKPPVHPQNRVVVFKRLGNTWAEVFSNIFSPRLFIALADKLSTKLLYWLLIILPLLLLSTGLRVILVLKSKRIELRLPSPLLILCECLVFFSPWFALTMISSYIPFFTLGWHLNAIGLGPVAAVMPTLAKSLKSRRRAYATLLLFFAYVALGSPLSPIPYVFRLTTEGPFMGAAYDFNPWFSNLEEELKIANEIRQALSMIPNTASVLAVQNIFPHISTRANVYVQVPSFLPDYIIIDERFFTWWDLETQHWVYQHMLNNSTYVEIYRTSNVRLLKRV